MVEKPHKMISEGMSLDKLKQSFPHLYNEYVQGKIGISNLYEKRGKDPWMGYTPNFKDFLARAKTEKECLEIIEYLERRGEIGGDLAKELRERTLKFGPQSFGTRDKDYYSKFIRD